MESNKCADFGWDCFQKGGPLVHKNGYLTNQAVLLKVFLVVKGVLKHLLLNI